MLLGSPLHPAPTGLEPRNGATAAEPRRSFSAAASPGPQPRFSAAQRGATAPPRRVLGDSGQSMQKRKVCRPNMGLMETCNITPNCATRKTGSPKVSCPHFLTAL